VLLATPALRQAQGPLGPPWQQVERAEVATAAFESVQPVEPALAQQRATAQEAQ
jgi:hypothetical protein